MINQLIILIFVLSFGTLSIAQEDVSEKITPQAIEARIKENRIGKIIIKSRPGQQVIVQQTRHEFLFGTAIPSSLAENARFSMSDNDRAMYLKVLKENFNYAVHENALKWYATEREENEVDYAVADRIWEMCNELNIPMRGHCIFWAKDKFVQPWQNKLNTDQLRSAVKRRAVSVTSHFKDRITEFDLNNEMIHGDFYRRRLGYGIINEMAMYARLGNPDVKLYLNDYGVLDLGFNADTYIWHIRNLLAMGVQIDGIGCQAHLAHSYEAVTPREHVQKTLDALSQFNLPIKITENLFVFEDEKVQEEQFRKIFPIYFAHPNVEAIITWGFWGKNHWIPYAAMYNEDWTKRPIADAYRELVFGKWWTTASGKTDSNGIYAIEAFYGDYEIIVNGESRKASLKKADKVLEIKFN